VNLPGMPKITNIESDPTERTIRVSFQCEDFDEWTRAMTVWCAVAESQAADERVCQNDTEKEAKKRRPKKRKVADRGRKKSQADPEDSGQKKSHERRTTASEHPQNEGYSANEKPPKKKRRGRQPKKDLPEVHEDTVKAIIKAAENADSQFELLQTIQVGLGISPNQLLKVRVEMGKEFYDKVKTKAGIREIAAMAAQHKDVEEDEIPVIDIPPAPPPPPPKPKPKKFVSKDELVHRYDFSVGELERGPGII